MAKNIMIDELHLSVFAPSGLRGKPFRAIRRTLGSARFHTALRRAIRGAFARYPSLGSVTFTLTR